MQRTICKYYFTASSIADTSVLSKEIELSRREKLGNSLLSDFTFPFFSYYCQLYWILSWMRQVRSNFRLLTWRNNDLFVFSQYSFPLSFFLISSVSFNFLSCIKFFFFSVSLIARHTSINNFFLGHIRCLIYSPQLSTFFKSYRDCCEIDNTLSEWELFSVDC